MIIYLERRYSYWNGPRLDLYTLGPFGRILRSTHNRMEQIAGLGQNYRISIANAPETR